MSNRKNRKKSDAENQVEETTSNASPETETVNDTETETESDHEEVVEEKPVLEEKEESKPLITKSDKPNFTPKKVELSEEEKNINPPAFEPVQNTGMAWGPANKRRRR